MAPPPGISNLVWSFTTLAFREAVPLLEAVALRRWRMRPAMVLAGVLEQGVEKCVYYGVYSKNWPAFSGNDD